jgi:zinc finger-containing ubiquitin peptidase 1
MTIIGFEVRKDGAANLLVFDPSFKTSPAIRKAIGNSIRTQTPAKLLKIYRRGLAYLHKYQEFEILKLLV